VDLSNVALYVIIIGVHHLKLWSFAATSTNFVNGKTGVSSMVCRTGRIDKKVM